MNENININVSGPNQPTSIYKTVILKGNKSFASQVTEPNIKYVIKHNFDLGDGTVTVPENCILEFDGGAIVGGNLNCNKNLVIFNGYDGENVYNVKPGTPSGKIKIYNQLAGSSAISEAGKQKIKLGQKRGYNGCVFCPYFSDTALTPSEIISSMIELASFAKSIGYDVHALKPNTSGIDTIDELNNAIDIIRQAATALHDAIGDVEYLVMFGENRYITEATDTTIIESVNNLISDLHDLGYKVIIQPDSGHILSQIYTESVYDVDVVGGDIYTSVSGCFGARTVRDVIESFKHTVAEVKEVKTRTGKPYIVNEVGICPFEECFYEPGNWNYAGYTYNKNVPYIYLKGVFSSFTDVVEEIWPWYDNYFNEDVYNLFRDITGNGK